jgi:threonine synthase
VASGCKAVSLAERDDAGLARWLLQFGNEAAIQRVFAKAKRQRSRYMRPVPAPAASLATGILDDETYDWFAICSAMIRTGGWPIVVSEQDLTLAVEQGRNETGCPVCPTGSAGLAGLLVARREGQLAPGAQAGVVFTGVER